MIFAEWPMAENLISLAVWSHHVSVEQHNYSNHSHHRSVSHAPKYHSETLSFAMEGGKKEAELWPQ